MSPSRREKFLHDAAAAKMSAMRLRALGDADDQRQVIALLHDAARREIAALDASPKSSAEEETCARIEACGLLLEAQDPVGAVREWSRLPSWAFTSEEGAALLSAIRERYAAETARFSEAWRALAGVPGAAPALDALSAARLQVLCDAYPGVAELWWALAARTSGEQAEAARERMRQIDPDLARDEEARGAWERIEQTLAPTVKIAMRAERSGGVLFLDLVSRVAGAFGDLLSDFVEKTFGEPVDFVPSGAVSGSFILDVSAQGLPPFALGAMDQALTDAPERVGARRLAELLELLQQDGIRLAVSTISGASQTKVGVTQELVIDARRRKALLEAAEAAALRNIESRDVPQADDLERVFDVVQRTVAHEQADGEAFGITPRQVGCYRRAAKILGLLAESGEPTAAGRLIARLSPDDRLRATVVYFESSVCGDAWIRWSKGKTLLDVAPDTALDFLRANVPGLSEDTAGRRAATLVAWHRDLIGHHYARSADADPATGAESLLSNFIPVDEDEPARPEAARPPRRPRGRRAVG